MSSKSPKSAAHLLRLGVLLMRSSLSIEGCLLCSTANCCLIQSLRVVYNLGRPWKKGRFSDQVLRTWSFPRGSALPGTADCQIRACYGPASRPYVAALSSLAGGAVGLTAVCLGTLLTGCRPRTDLVTASSARLAGLAFVWNRCSIYQVVARRVPCNESKGGARLACER